MEFWGSLVERLVSRALEASWENTDPLPSADSAGANRRGERGWLLVMLEHTSAKPGHLSGGAGASIRDQTGREWGLLLVAELAWLGHQAGCWANPSLRAGPSRWAQRTSVIGRVPRVSKLVRRQCRSSRVRGRALHSKTGHKRGVLSLKPSSNLTEVANCKF